MLRTFARYGMKGTAGFAAVTSVALGQAVLHERSYEPLPSLQAPMLGRELPERLKELALEKREELRRKIRAKTEDLKEGVSAKTRDLRERWQERTRRMLAPLAPLVQDESVYPGDTPTASSKVPRVLFVGDSLVTGVGGSSDESREHGPPLPRRVCRALAERLGVQVEWRALGLTGGDLKALRRLLPEIDGEYDVVVVMCGLNDFKHIARGQFRTPWAFRDELEALVAEIRAEVGDECRIVLPALPVSLAQFSEPLKSYVTFIANQWDQQKVRLARLNCVDFIDVLTLDPTLKSELLVAGDGVHPNERGYEMWSQHIALSIAQNLGTARVVPPPRRD